jgi:hypothetical protein
MQLFVFVLFTWAVYARLSGHIKHDIHLYIYIYIYVYTETRFSNIFYIKHDVQIYIICLRYIYEERHALYKMV